MPPAKGKSQRRPARRTPKAKPKRPAKPKLRLAVIKEIIRSYLQEARKQLEYEQDGMDRLIRALQRPKPRVKKKKAG